MEADERTAAETAMTRPGSERKSSDWMFRHEIPFIRLLRETENACIDRITAVMPPAFRPIEQGNETEIQTAAWLAMLSWKEEVAPCYEKLIAEPDLEATTKIRLDHKYSDFLCQVSDALLWCEQYAAAKRLLLEGRAHFAGDARKWIEKQLGDLEKDEAKLGHVFDAEKWADYMPRVVKATTASKTLADQKSTSVHPHARGDNG